MVMYYPNCHESMSLLKMFYWLKYRLSPDMYVCFYCHHWFNLKKRLNELQPQFPQDAKLNEYSDYMNYCSDKCCTDDHNVDTIVKNFTDGIE